MIISVFIFICFLIVFVWLSGWAIFKVTRIEEPDRFIALGIVLVLGILCVTLWVLGIRLIGIPWWGIWGLPVISLLLIKNQVSSPIKVNKKETSIFQTMAISLIIICAILQSFTLSIGTQVTPNGRSFPAIHDTMWTIAISNEISKQVPPQNPAFSGITLKNHHFFYPLFISAIQNTVHLPIITLYYYILPPLVSGIFGISIYAVSKIFVKRKLFQLITIFLGYFFGNIAFILPLFLGMAFDWKGNSFFSDQPFDQLTNPYTVLGFAFYLFGVYIFYLATKSDKPNVGYLFLVSAIYASLYGFKSFAGIIALVAMTLTCGLIWVLSKKSAYLWCIFLFYILFIPIFLLITSPSNVTLRWRPGWLLTEMMVSQDKLNLPRYSDIENYYRNIGNKLGLLKIRSLEFVIYMVGNLGLRIIGMVFLPVYGLLSIFKRKNKNLPVILLINASVIIALFIPLLFNLGGSAHNIIQFTPYALLLLVFPTMQVFEYIFNYLHQQGRPFPAIILVVGFISLAIPVNIKNIIQKLTSVGEVIPYSELAAIDYLKNYTNSADIIAVDTVRYTGSAIYIAGLSERRVYLADAGLAVQTGNDPTKRLKDLTEFFSNHSPETLLNTPVKYIYLLKKHLDKDSQKFFANSYLKKAYENTDVIVFKYGKI